MASVLAPEPHTGLTLAPPPASVIRDAAPADAARAWELQRQAFSLPEEGAPPHPGSHDELRVLVEGERVVSCLTLIHAELWIGGARLAMGGIRHVATDPEVQNQGHAGALVRDTLRLLRARRVPAAVLYPFSFRYYRKFGFELGGNHVQFWCRPNCIPAYTERRLCRSASLADAEELAKYHAERAGDAACLMAKDAWRWRQWLESPELRVWRCGGDRITGYAVTTETRDAYGGRILRILDLCASDREAWRALLGHFSQTGAESVEWLTTAGDLQTSGLLRTTAPLREGFKPRGVATVRPLFQFRLVDLEEALRARLDRFGEGPYRLALRVRDEQLPENERPLTVHAAPGGRPDVSPAQPGDPWLEADVRIMSQIYCGYLCPAEAISQDLARVSSPEALEAALRLFPAGDPFLSELDRF